MITVQKTTTIEAPASFVFDAIYDLDLYKDFIPWCNDAGYLDGNAQDKQNGNGRNAFIDISIGMLTYRIQTFNSSSFPTNLNIVLVKGPLQSLRGDWLIEPKSENSCLASVDMQFQTKLGLVGKLIGKPFDFMCNQLIDLFKNRAESLYLQSLANDDNIKPRN